MNGEWQSSAISSGAHHIINTLTAMSKAGALYAALTLRMESACETRTHQVKKNEAKGCSVTVDFWAK